MRHKLFSLLMVLLCSCYAIANDNTTYPRHQLHIGVGTGSISYFANIFSNDIRIVNNNDWMKGVTVSDNYQHIGSYNLGYLCTITPVYSCGVDFVYSGLTQHVNNLEYHTFSRNAIHEMSLLFTSRFSYCRYEHVNLYSGVSVGFCCQYGTSSPIYYTTNDKNNYFTFAAQLTPIGVSVGGTHFRYFCELGLGHKGLCTMGLQYRFGKQQ